MQDSKINNTCERHNLSYSKHKNEDLCQPIILANLSLLHEMTNRHDKVFFMMFALSIPSTSADCNRGNNSYISKLIDSLTTYCINKMYDPMYLWTREDSTGCHAEYNFMFLFNGDLVQEAYGILEKANELWARASNIQHGPSLIHLCNPEPDIKYYRNFIKHGGVVLKKKDQHFTDAFIHCFGLANYIVMRSSKNGARTYVNEYGCSRHR